MIIYRKIDLETGMFIEDVISDGLLLMENGEPDPAYIALPCPPGFYWPRWNGEKWIEGRTAEEITATQAAAQEHELTDIEKLKIRQDATENAVLFLMDMGGML